MAPAPLTTAIPLRPPATLRVRTRMLAETADAVVLRALGSFLGSLLTRDLAIVCRAATSPATTWRGRKHALTAPTSARWAGAITKEANRLYATARSGQRTALGRTRAAIRAIRDRLGRPLRCDQRPPAAGTRTRAGYGSPRERAMKRWRLRILEGRAARFQREFGARRVHVCRGGKALLRHRHYLTEVGLTVDAWRGRWESARAFIHANGETGKSWGNETIRVYPDGTGLLAVEVNLPPHLHHLANAPRGRYRLHAKPFAYRDKEWTNHIKAKRACAYDIAYDVEKQRWYLDASFTPAPPFVPDWNVVSADPALRVLAVDLNNDHLACCVLDHGGNPVGKPWSIPLALRGFPASTRDGHLRQTISTLIHDAQQYGCRAIICEFLDLEDARSTMREDVPAPRVRAAIAGLPTMQFRNRLTAMAARCGLAVVSVDPKNSSAWGAQHWQRALARSGYRASGHHAAACVLGRRALGYGARRRGEQPAPHQRMEATPVLAGVGAADHLPGRDRVTRVRGPNPPPKAARQFLVGRKTGAGNGDAGAAQALQDRLGSAGGRVPTALGFRNGRTGAALRSAARRGGM